MFEKLEAHRADYAVVARLTTSLKRLLPGLRYTPRLTVGHNGQVTGGLAAREIIIYGKG